LPKTCAPDERRVLTVGIAACCRPAFLHLNRYESMFKSIAWYLVYEQRRGSFDDATAMMGAAAGALETEKGFFPRFAVSASIMR
jgi:hypothetical protein